MIDEPPPPEPPPLPLPPSRPHPLALGCAGITAFGLACVAFLIVGMASLDHRAFGILIPLVVVALVIWGFVKRTRSGPAPFFGALVAGLSIAMIVYGICYASMGTFRIQ